MDFKRLSGPFAIALEKVCDSLDWLFVRSDRA
jgi:hypothetical protein